MPQPATLLKKRLWHRCLPLNFAKFLRTSFLQSTSRQLLLVFKANNKENKTKLKVVSATFLQVCFVCLKESTSEARKNVFYFTMLFSFLK